MNTLEYFVTFWYILEYSRIKWNDNDLGYSIISWSILEYSQIFTLESCSRAVLYTLKFYAHLFNKGCPSQPKNLPEVCLTQQQCMQTGFQVFSCIYKLQTYSLMEYLAPRATFRHGMCARRSLTYSRRWPWQPLSCMVYTWCTPGAHSMSQHCLDLEGRNIHKFEYVSKPICYPYMCS